MTTLFDQTHPSPGPRVGIPDAPNMPGAGVPHARTQTSAEAARRLAETGEAATLQSLVMSALHSAGHDGLTARELADEVSRRRGRRTEQGKLMSFTRGVLSRIVDAPVGQWVVRRRKTGNCSFYALEPSIFTVQQEAASN